MLREGACGPCWLQGRSCCSSRMPATVCCACQLRRRPPTPPALPLYRPAVSAALPAVLGLVFVAVALLSWSQLQHWRGRSGAGYQAAGAADAAGRDSLRDIELLSGREGHLGEQLGHRGGARDERA